MFSKGVCRQHCYGREPVGIAVDCSSDAVRQLGKHRLLQQRATFSSRGQVGVYYVVWYLADTQYLLSIIVRTFSFVNK